MTTHEILDALANVEAEHFPDAALRAAEKRRKALIPHFRTEIELSLALADAGNLQEEGDWRLTNFALYLLAAWQVPGAYEFLMRTMLLRDPYDREWLISDAIEADWSHLLVTTFPGGDVETRRLQAIVLDTSLDEIVRYCALRVIGGAVYRRKINRRRIIEWFHWLFECDLSTEMQLVWTGLFVQCALSKDPGLMKRLRKTYPKFRPWIKDIYHLREFEEIARSPWPRGNAPCNSAANPVTNVKAMIYEWPFFRDGRMDPKRRAFWEEFLGPEPEETGRRGAMFRNEPEIGRDENCPCGSGRKYRHCCGKV